MSHSIFRRFLAAAAATLIVPAAALWAFPHTSAWVVVLSAAPGALAGLVIARSVATRLDRLATFAKRMLDPEARREALPASDDEIGVLSYALAAAGVEIDDLIDRLTTELSRREAMLATMVEAVVAVDGKLNITFWNEAFRDAVGQPRMEDGQPLIKAVREPDLLEMFKEAMESEGAIRRRIRMSAADGRSFDVCASPLAGAGARGVVATLHDVTPSENLDRVRRDFVANVSHELRTPLATIRGYAETLLEGAVEDTENRGKFLEIILANAVRLNNIAADLLTLSDLEDGRPQTEGAAIPVSDALSAAIAMVEPVARVRDVRILAEEFPRASVWGHRIRFEQAIVNLLDNAVKFNQPGGEVRVRAKLRDAESLEIAIADTGIGIPSRDLGRIFERFYRVDKARSRQVAGTGLGLSIAKHAILQMGGNVTVESKPGQGSTFTIVLPMRVHSASVS